MPPYPERSSSGRSYHLPKPPPTGPRKSTRPPSPCKHCGGDHYHNECPSKGNRGSSGHRDRRSDTDQWMCQEERCPKRGFRSGLHERFCSNQPGQADPGPWCRHCRLHGHTPTLCPGIPLGKTSAPPKINHHSRAGHTCKHNGKTYILYPVRPYYEQVKGSIHGYPRPGELAWYEKDGLDIAMTSRADCPICMEWGA